LQLYLKNVEKIVKFDTKTLDIDVNT